MPALIVFALALVSPVQTTAPAPVAPAASAPAATSYSTAATPIGTLIADPAALAILEKNLPGISTNPQLQQVLTMTLRAVQPFAPDKLTDQKLGAIDTELAALPPKS